MSDLRQINALNVRVWYTEGGAHPSKVPEFLALGKFSDDPAQTIGEATKVSAPDPNSFNKDIQLGTVEGERERATLGIGIRTTNQRSTLMDWKNKGCRVDIYALVGKCGNPQDFTEGGEKWIYFPDGRISDHSYENFGAWGRDENNPTNEMVSMTAEEYYEFLFMRQEQIGSAYTTREIYTVDTYPGDECDECPDPCDKVMLTMAGANATPGTQPVLLYSADGGVTFSTQTISTLFSNEDVADGEVVGGDLVLISYAGNEIHYTSCVDLYDNASNTWKQTDTGFVAARGPRALSAADARHLWIVGDGGYVYFAANYKTKVEVQDAGVATSQHLQDVNAYDKNNVLAVGNSNAVIYTKNSGETWESVTGPAVGVNLGACWMWDADTWFVGEGAGGSGRLWLTVNHGGSWTQVSLPGGTYSRIYDIKFISEAEGYLSAQSGGQSYILRTITGGNEWVVLPQGKSGTAVDNSYLSDIAVCSRYANVAYAAGLADNGTAGIALKMSA